MTNLVKAIDNKFGKGFAYHINTLIHQYRQTQELMLFDEFKFEVIHHQTFGDIDKNYWQRQTLVLLLSKEFKKTDTPLIRWLILEFCQNTEKGVWVDLRSVMALLGFMLYKHMDNDDLPVLYQTKFGACSDSRYSVDIEIILGFGVEQTLDYLNQHKKQNTVYKEMTATIKHYNSHKTKPFRTYKEYCHFFEQHRLLIHQEEIMGDCGFLTDSINEIK